MVCSLFFCKWRYSYLRIFSNHLATFAAQNTQKICWKDFWKIFSFETEQVFDIKPSYILVEKCNFLLSLLSVTNLFLTIFFMILSCNKTVLHSRFSCWCLKPFLENLLLFASFNSNKQKKYRKTMIRNNVITINYWKLGREKNWKLLIFWGREIALWTYRVILFLTFTHHSQIILTLWF